MIEKIPAAFLQYLAKFGSTAVDVSAAGRIIVTANPVGCRSAWWAHTRELAKRVATEARKTDRHIVSAAKRLGITLTEHDTVMQRASARVRRIQEAVDTAEQAGVLKFFNQEYQRRRQAAVAAGKNLPPYTAMRARLRRALAKRAANPAGRMA